MLWLYLNKWLYYTLHSYFEHAVGNLIQFINSKIRRSEEDVLFIYVQNEIITAKDSTMAKIYQEYREDDYFLYLAYYERNLYDIDACK